MGFDLMKIPHRTTFATQRWERYQHDFANTLSTRPRKLRSSANGMVWKIYEKAEEIIDESDRRDTGEYHDIANKYRLENEDRDHVFNEFRDLYNDLLNYDRGPNKQIPAENLTELATSTSRRNESVVVGRDVCLKEN